MKSKLKKIFKIALVSLFCLLVCLCIFWPKLFVLYLKNMQYPSYLDVKPKMTTQINNKNNNSTSQNIGLIKADLNQTKIQKIEFSDNLFLNIEYDSYYLRLLAWQDISNDEFLSFSKHYEVINTTTEDAKILNNIGVNITVFVNLILKAIMMTSDHIEVVNTDDLRIISQPATDNKRHTMFLSVYDQSDKYSQSIIIESKNSKEDLYNKYSLFINSLSPSEIEMDFNQLMEPLSENLQKNISTD